MGDPIAYTITEFCAAYRISRPHYFRVRADGRGPRETRIGAKIIISRADADAWLKDQQNLTGELATKQAETDARVAANAANALRSQRRASK